MGIPVAIGLGSNVGDREAVLQRALEELRNELTNLEASSIFETKPMYLLDQGKFLNMVAIGETNLSPREFLFLLKTIERNLGRIDRARNGPREVDLDLLIYGNLGYSFTFEDGKELQIPHPRLSERAFVMIPLAEIAPNWPIIEKGTAQSIIENTDWDPEDCRVFSQKF